VADTFDGRCASCGHVWTVAHLPMELSKLAKLAMAAQCPKGCDAKVMLASPKKEADRG
jgi:hypothetical protein